MRPEFVPAHALWLLLAITLEVAANLLMKRSDGFRRRGLAMLALACALIAFTALSAALGGFQLSVAYGLWGGIGLIATAVLGVVRFGEHLQPRAWLGLGCIIAGMVLLKSA